MADEVPTVPPLGRRPTRGRVEVGVPAVMLAIFLLNWKGERGSIEGGSHSGH